MSCQVSENDVRFKSNLYHSEQSLRVSLAGSNEYRTGWLLTSRTNFFQNFVLIFSPKCQYKLGIVFSWARGFICTNYLPKSGKKAPRTSLFKIFSESSYFQILTQKLSKMGYFRRFCPFWTYFLKIWKFTKIFEMNFSRCFFHAFGQIISANEPPRSGEHDSELILTFWRKNQHEILKKVCTTC